VLQARATAADSDAKAQKHAHRGDDGFGASDAPLPSLLPDERAECLRFKALRLIAQLIQQGGEWQTIPVEGCLGGPAMGLHPPPKAPKQGGLSGWGKGRGWWCH
jgi:hypothetical protein